tara:strand:- start:430 stop:855 length:426 start_codon:yes stop_codon:yes gene_type:complete
MKQAFKLIITVTIFFSCEKNVKISEDYLIKKKIEAFKFLSDYHHQLHIMIGVEDGDKKKALNEFKSAPVLKTNEELIPIQNALARIDDEMEDFSQVKRLDDLVDYYQSGLSIQIEAILRGYGYKKSLDMDDIYTFYLDLIK